MPVNVTDTGLDAVSSISDMGGILAIIGLVALIAIFMQLEWFRKLLATLQGVIRLTVYSFIGAVTSLTFLIIYETGKAIGQGISEVPPEQILIGFGAYLGFAAIGWIIEKVIKCIVGNWNEIIKEPAEELKT